MDAVRRVALVGAKGGSGTTLLAANLGAVAQRGGSSCVLDLDCRKGDLAALLDVRPKVIVPELWGSDCDASRLRGSASHLPGGLCILGQPDAMAQLARPLPTEALGLLALAAAAWDTLVVDCGAGLDEVMVAVLAEVDAVVIVATPDVLAVRNARRLDAVLGQVGVPEARRLVVLNRVDRHDAFDTADIEAAARVHVAARLPRDDAACARAVGEGALLADVAPGSPLVRAVEDLWSLVRGEPLAPRTSRWRIPWLGGEP